MGLKFRKSAKIAPGVKLNINKKSVSMTAGTKNLHYTKSTSGKTTKSANIPGTGISYSSSSGKKKNNKSGKKKGSCLLYFLIFFIICGIIGSFTKSNKPQNQEESAITATPEQTQEPTKAPDPTATPAGTATPIPTPTPELVWVPTNGGTKYHFKSSCSQMENPEQITKEDAISRGFEPCGRCE